MILLGIAAALLALVLETTISIIGMNGINEILSTSLFSSIALVAFIEEFSLGIIIWKTFQNITSRKQILINSILIGAGFALFEIFLNILSRPESSLSSLFSYLGLFLIHVSTSSIFGLYFSSRIKRVPLGIIVIFLFNTLIHFLFNVAILNNFNQLLLYLIFILGLSFLCLQAFKIQKNHSLPR